MSTTASTTSATSSAQHTAPTPPHKRDAQGQPPADLFSQLLALVGDGATLDSGASEPAPLADTAADTDGQEAGDPLAQLMAWVAPLPQDGALPTAGAPSGLVAETRSLDARAERQAGLGESAPAGTRRGAAGAAHTLLGSASTALQGARAPGAGASDIPAMHWSRASAPADSGAGAGASAWPVRSTVALDARLQAAAGAPAGLAALRAAVAEGADEPSLPGASPLPGARSGGDAAPALVTAAGGAADAGLGGDGGADAGGSFGEPANEQNTAQPDPYATPADAEAVQVQHWGTGALRHASLRVGEGGAEAQNAIDIQLDVRGDEVRLDIRTDDAAARELLREQAQATLGERLQQGGLSLGSVSVGEQQQNPGQGASDRRDPGAMRSAAARAEAPLAAAPAAPAAPSRDGGARGALDLFI